MYTLNSADVPINAVLWLQCPYTPSRFALHGTVSEGTSQLTRLHCIEYSQWEKHTVANKNLKCENKETAKCEERNEVCNQDRNLLDHQNLTMKNVSAKPFDLKTSNMFDIFNCQTKSNSKNENNLQRTVLLSTTARIGNKMHRIFSMLKSGRQERQRSKGAQVFQKRF